MLFVWGVEFDYIDINVYICIHIYNGAAMLRNEWRSLQEEGPPHVNSKVYVAFVTLSKL